MAEAPRALRATVGVAVVLLAVGVRQLLRPSSPPLPIPTPSELVEAERTLLAQRWTTAYLVFLGDKGAALERRPLGVPDVRACAAAPGSRSTIRSGPRRAVPGLIRRFLEMVDDADGVPVFYQVRKDSCTTTPISASPSRRPAKKRSCRSRRSRSTAARARRCASPTTGSRTTARRSASLPPRDVPALLPTLRDVSDEWLDARRARPRKGFSLGFFDDDYLVALSASPCWR